MAVQISPSILNSDFARLADEVASISQSADWVHVDVMDNHFVPNLTLGPPVVEALRKASALPLDCHLMIEDPDRWAPAYVEAGASSVTFHVEAAADPVRWPARCAPPGRGSGWPSSPARRSSPTRTCSRSSTWC
jgi:ribulose-phosphate 3-epimerase